MFQFFHIKFTVEAPVSAAQQQNINNPLTTQLALLQLHPQPEGQTKSASNQDPVNNQSAQNPVNIHNPLVQAVWVDIWTKNNTRSLH